MRRMNKKDTLRYRKTVSKTSLFSDKDLQIFINKQIYERDFLVLLIVSYKQVLPLR